MLTLRAKPGLRSAVLVVDLVPREPAACAAMDFVPRELTVLPIPQVVLSGPTDLCAALHARLSRCVGFTQPGNASGFSEGGRERPGLLPAYRLCHGETRGWIQLWGEDTISSADSLSANNQQSRPSRKDSLSRQTETHDLGQRGRPMVLESQVEGWYQDNQKADTAHSPCDIQRHLSLEWFRNIAFETPASLVLVFDLRTFPLTPRHAWSPAQTRLAQSLKLETQQTFDAFRIAFKNHFWARALGAGCPPVFPRLTVILVFDLMRCADGYPMDDVRPPAFDLDDTFLDVSGTGVAGGTQRPSALPQDANVSTLLRSGPATPAKARSVSSSSAKGDVSLADAAEMQTTVLRLMGLNEKDIESLSGIIHQNCRHFFETSVHMLKRGVSPESPAAEVPAGKSAVLRSFHSLHHEVEQLLHVSFLLEYAHDAHGARRSYMGVWDTLVSQSVASHCVCPTETVATLVTVSVRLVLWFCRLGDTRRASAHVHALQSALQTVLIGAPLLAHVAPLWTAVIHFLITQFSSEQWFASRCSVVQLQCPKEEPRGVHDPEMSLYGAIASGRLHSVSMDGKMQGWGAGGAADAPKVAETASGHSRGATCLDVVTFRHYFASLAFMGSARELYGVSFSALSGARGNPRVAPCVLAAHVQPLPLFDHESVEAASRSDYAREDSSGPNGRQALKENAEDVLPVGCVDQRGALIQFTFRVVYKLYASLQNLRTTAPRIMAVFGISVAHVFFELRRYHDSLRVYVATLQRLAGPHCQLFTETDAQGRGPPWDGFLHPGLSRMPPLSDNVVNTSLVGFSGFHDILAAMFARMLLAVLLDSETSPHPYLWAVASLPVPLSSEALHSSSLSYCNSAALTRDIQSFVDDVVRYITTQWPGGQAKVQFLRAKTFPFNEPGSSAKLADTPDGRSRDEPHSSLLYRCGAIGVLGLLDLHRSLGLHSRNDRISPEHRSGNPPGPEEPGFQRWLMSFPWTWEAKRRMVQPAGTETTGDQTNGVLSFSKPTCLNLRFFLRSIAASVAVGEPESTVLRANGMASAPSTVLCEVSLIHWLGVPLLIDLLRVHLDNGSHYEFPMAAVVKHVATQCATQPRLWNLERLPGCVSLENGNTAAIVPPHQAFICSVTLDGSSADCRSGVAGAECHKPGMTVTVIEFRCASLSVKSAPEVWISPRVLLPHSTVLGCTSDAQCLAPGGFFRPAVWPPFHPYSLHCFTSRPTSELTARDNILSCVPAITWPLGNVGCPRNVEPLVSECLGDTAPALSLSYPPLARFLKAVPSQGSVTFNADPVTDMNALSTAQASGLLCHSQQTVGCEPTLSKMSNAVVESHSTLLAMPIPSGAAGQPTPSLRQPESFPNPQQPAYRINGAPLMHSSTSGGVYVHFPRQVLVNDVASSLLMTVEAVPTVFTNAREPLLLHVSYSPLLMSGQCVLYVTIAPASCHGRPSSTDGVDTMPSSESAGGQPQRPSMSYDPVIYGFNFVSRGTSKGNCSAGRDETIGCFSVDNRVPVLLPASRNALEELKHRCEAALGRDVFATVYENGGATRTDDPNPRVPEDFPPVLVLHPTASFPGKPEKKPERHSRFALPFEKAGFELYYVVIPFYVCYKHPGTYSLDVRVQVHRDTELLGTVYETLRHNVVPPFQPEFQFVSLLNTHGVTGSAASLAAPLPSNAESVVPFANAVEVLHPKAKLLQQTFLTIALKNISSEPLLMCQLRVLTRTHHLLASVEGDSPVCCRTDNAVGTGSSRPGKRPEDTDASSVPEVAVVPREGEWTCLLDVAALALPETQFPMERPMDRPSQSPYIIEAQYMRLENGRAPTRSILSLSAGHCPFRRHSFRMIVPEAVWKHWTRVLPVEVLVSHDPVKKVGEAVVVRATAVNNTHKPQGFSVRLVYPPVLGLPALAQGGKRSSTTVLPPNVLNALNVQRHRPEEPQESTTASSLPSFSSDCPFFVGGRLQSSLLIPPRGTEHMSWTLIPSRPGILSLPSVSLTVVHGSLPIPSDAGEPGLCDLSLTELLQLETGEQQSENFVLRSPVASQPSLTTFVSSYSQISVVP